MAGSVSRPAAPAPAQPASGASGASAEFNSVAQGQPANSNGSGVNTSPSAFTFGTTPLAQGSSAAGAGPLAAGPVSYGNIANQLQSGGALNNALGLGNMDAAQAGKLGNAIRSAEEGGAPGFDGNLESFSTQDLNALKGNMGLLDELRAKALGLPEEMTPEEAMSEEALGSEPPAAEEAAAGEAPAGEAPAGAAPAGGEAPAGGAPAGGAPAGGAPAGGEAGGLEGKDLNGDGKVDEKDKEILEMLKKAVEASGGDPNDPAALQKALDEYSGGDGKIDESDMAKLKEAAGGSDSTSSDSEGEGSDTLSSFANSNDPLAALTG